MKSYFLSIILSLVAILSAGAHGGSRHREDMREVFPFDGYEGQNIKVKDFFDAINTYLDQPDDEYTRAPEFVRNDPKFSKIGFGSHRVWYHWGFNTDPVEFGPMKDAMSKWLCEGYLIYDDVERFNHLLREDVGRRNRALMDKAAEVFGYKMTSYDVNDSDYSNSGLQRKQLNAFATIAYSVHILGDYTTSQYGTDHGQYIVASKEAIYKDVLKAIGNLAGKESGNKKKGDALQYKLRQIKNERVFLDVLKSDFSDFILSLRGGMYDYKRRFEERRYRLK